MILRALLLLLAWPAPALAYGVDASIYVAIIGSLVSTAISVGISLLTAPNIKGPRQKDSGIQTSDYGRPLALAYGPSNRVAGTVIYYSGLQEQSRKKSGSGGSTTTYTYSCTAAIALCEGRTGMTLSRIWANKKVIYEEGVFSVMESVAFYDGNASQNPDPTLESYLGVGEVPAYRHTCYCVIKNIELADFGPTLPQFEFEFAADSSTSVDAVVSDIAERAGIEVDVSLLSGNVGALDGYIIDRDVSAADAIAPLAAAYYFDVAERGGSLVCVPRGMDAVATLYMTDGGATPGGQPPQGTIEHARAPEAELPQEVSVTYRDLFRDYQPSTERAQRSLGEAQENVGIDIPLTLDSDQARRLAHRLLWGIIATRRTAKARISPRWINLLPADIVNVETPAGALLPYRVTKSTLGADGVLALELQYEDADIYDCGVPAGGGVATTDPDDEAGDPSTPPGDTTLVLIDAPLLRDAHDNAGFYIVVGSSSAAWRGATVYRSTDGGTDYEPITDALGAGTIGTVATATPSGPTDVWDRASTIRVTMLDADNELETRSELSILNGLNSAWIGPASGVGGEVIQFATATLVSAGVYDLTDLLRGRRGTEWTVGNHGADELFVLLDDSAFLIRKDFGTPDLDLARLYKPVSVLQSIDDAPSQSFTNTGEGLRPWAPAHLVGRLDSTLGLTVTWKHRTRLFSSGIGAVTPLGEEEEIYQLDFYEPAEEWVLGSSYSIGDIRRAQSAFDYGWRYYRAQIAHTASAANKPDQTSANWRTRWTEVQPARSVTLTDRRTYIYTVAAQSADGQTPGASFHIQCRQRSASRGYGHPALSVT